MRYAVIVVMVVTSTFTARNSSAADIPETTLVVRTYSAIPIADVDRAFAIDAANEILQPTGIRVRWIACDASPAMPDGRCLAPLAVNELAIRFVPQAPETNARANEVVLGYSLIDRHATFAVLATIYVERVERLASACNVPWTTVLGRAVAHEIGHLLLGTAEHASTGLMRAVWPRLAIERNLARDFQFSAEEAVALHRAVDARDASARPSPVVWGTE